MDYFTCLSRYADATARLLNYCGYLDDGVKDIGERVDYYDCDHSSWVIGYLTDLNCAGGVTGAATTTANQFYLEGLDQFGGNSGFSYILVVLSDGTVLDSVTESGTESVPNQNVLRRRKLDRDAIDVAITALGKCFDLADINFLRGLQPDLDLIKTTVKCRIDLQNYPCNLTPDHITTRFLALLQEAADLTTIAVQRHTWNFTKVKVLLGHNQVDPDLLNGNAYDAVRLEQLITAQLESYRSLTDFTALNLPGFATRVDPADIKSVQWLVGRSFARAVTDLKEIEPSYRLGLLMEETGDYVDYQPNRINVILDDDNIITGIVKTASGRWRF